MCIASIILLLCVFRADQDDHSLPGAIGMFGLALGVQQIGEVLPSAVYALLSGMNAATVGIVALAAVQVGLCDAVEL